VTFLVLVFWVFPDILVCETRSCTTPVFIGFRVDAGIARLSQQDWSAVCKQRTGGVPPRKKNCSLCLKRGSTTECVSLCGNWTHTDCLKERILKFSKLVCCFFCFYTFRRKSCVTLASFCVQPLDCESGICNLCLRGIKNTKKANQRCACCPQFHFNDEVSRCDTESCKLVNCVTCSVAMLDKAWKCGIHVKTITHRGLDRSYTTYCLIFSPFFLFYTQELPNSFVIFHHFCFVFSVRYTRYTWAMGQKGTDLGKVCKLSSSCDTKKF